MTFSRRATAEMTKRVERISRKTIDKAGVMTDAPTWRGPSMALVLGCCGNTLAKSGWIRRLRSTIAWIPRT